MRVDTGYSQRVLDIEKVGYVSDIRTNLLSISKLTDKDLEVVFRKKDAIVIDKQNSVSARRPCRKSVLSTKETRTV